MDNNTTSLSSLTAVKGQGFAGEQPLPAGVKRIEHTGLVVELCILVRYMTPLCIRLHLHQPAKILGFEDVFRVPVVSM